MMTVEFVGVQPGDTLGSPSYFRATFESTLWAAIVDMAKVAGDVYDALAGQQIGYVAPINRAELAPGDTTFVFDVSVFYTAGPEPNAALLAGDLNALRYSARLRRLKRITESDAFGMLGPAGRHEEQAGEQTKADAESPTTKAVQLLETILARVGWALLLVLVIVAALLGWRVYRAGAALVPA